MKISIYKITTLSMVVALAFALTIATVRAEDSTSDKPPGIRPTIKAQINNRIEKNREIRNDILDKRQDIKDMRASTTEMRKDIKMERREDIKDLHASTTEMFKRNKEIRKEIAKRMEQRMFEIRKNALLKELNLSLTNLTNISLRIDSRITKAESEGRVLTDAKALLVTANEKLVKAKADVLAFQALTATTTTVTASTTVEVELIKPRKLGDTAIKSVKDARDAFQKVVVAIAHAMGKKVEAHATTTENVSN